MKVNNKEEEKREKVECCLCARPWIGKQITTARAMALVHLLHGAREVSSNLIHHFAIIIFIIIMIIYVNLNVATASSSFAHHLHHQQWQCYGTLFQV